MSTFCMGCMEQIEDEIIICPHCGYDNNSTKENPLHIDPGDIIHDRYIVGKSIGYGGFGVTYIGWDALLEHKIAIKEYMPSEFSTRALGTKEVTVFGGKKSEQFGCGLKRFHNEAKLLAKYNSEEGVVSVYDSFEENGTAYIIMELLDGISLSEHLKKEPQMPYDKAVQLVLPIIRSLGTIHAQSVLHRDIAPDNLILTTQGKLKLIDFGAARFVTTSQHSMSVLIKPGYTPEEQYSSHSEQGAYTDVYALGAVLYRMITGEVPPDSLERGAYYDKNKKDMLVPITDFVKDVPENIRNAIYNALCVRAADRTQTMEEFAKELTSTEPVPLRNKWLKKPGLPLWSKLLIAAAAITAVVVCAVVIPGIIGRNQGLANPNGDISIEEGNARVPSVLDQTLEKAVERLTEQTLLYSIAGKEYSTEIAADLVLRQSIDGGSVVKRNSMIDLVISGGAEMALVAPFEGMNAQEAIASLTEARFVYRLEEEFSDTIAEGYVIRQSAQAGTELAVGSEIVLTISKGRDPEQEFEETMIEAPDFVGKDYQEVLTIAQEMQLLIVVKEKLYSNEFAENTVMLQSVAAGSEIMTGSTIELTISLGKQIVRVPDLEYRTLDYARSQLDRLGLKNDVRYENSDVVQAGLVISFSPAKDAELVPGDTVYLVVSLGPKESATIPQETETTKPTVTEAPTTETTKATEPIAPTSIVFTGNLPTSLYQGGTAQLSVTVSPDAAADKSVTFRSSDTSVISVDAAGRITAINPGTATITASTSNGKTASHTITVTATELTLLAKSVTMPKNEEFVLSYTTNFAASSVAWRVDNTDVICFDRNDSNKSVIIKPLRAGQAKMIAELPGGLTRECTVIVNDPLTAKLYTTSLELSVGESAALEFEYIGSNQLGYVDQSGKYFGNQNTAEIIFDTEETDVIEVDDNGNIKAIGTGYATVRMYLNGYDTGLSCQIAVE
ncbi:MAG: PASTA domain-containing protein [Oscillospiraceae bacterium]|nr:PASTA domain-containing protein [Oscillospiraceae bacterium]